MRKTLAMQRGSKPRNCAQCGCDMRGRRAYEGSGKIILCSACVIQGYHLFNDGRVWHAQERADRLAERKTQTVSWWAD